MRYAVWLFFVAEVMGGGGAAGAATSKPATPSVHDLVLQLDSDSFAIRRAASLRLNSLNGDALPVVEKALAESEVGGEGKLRLQTALKYLRPRAQKQSRLLARESWETAQLRNAYLNEGLRDKAWDDLAVHAIEKYCDFRWAGAHAGVDVARARTASVEAFDKAVKAGCTDPLVLSLYHLSVGKNFGINEGRVPQPLQHTVFEATKRNYGPFVKLWIVSEQGKLTRNMRTDEGVRKGTKWLAELAATSDIPPTELDACENELYDACARAPGAMSMFDASIIADAYTVIAPDKAGPHCIKARSLIDLAFNYVSKASNRRQITGPVWTVFSDKLREAGSELTKAWECDPNDARIASLMILVQMATGSRADVDTWCSRAMEVDPDNLNACLRKLMFLSPAWYGSSEDMIAFGRECLHTENWRAGIPMVLARAHRSAADASGDVKTYYARPEVWEDLSAVYEGQLVNFPDDTKRRSEYIIVAARAEKWDVVRAQFELLGDRGDLATFGGRATMDYYRDKGIRLGHAPATRDSTIPPTPAGAPAR
jgi:hypothetical protein